MEYRDIVRTRRSIRGFRPDPIPRDEIEEIVEIARHCPSSMNTQPWHLHFVTGTPLDLIRRENTERMMSGADADREVPSHGRYSGVHRDRQKHVAAQLFEAAGIGWDDRADRQDWAMRGFRQFDAPVSAVGCVDRDIADGFEAYFDLGQFVHGLVLAAWERGIGSVINGQGIMQSSVVRKHARIPDDQIIVITVALGYPLVDFAPNDVVSERRTNDDILRYVGFAES